MDEVPRKRGRPPGSKNKPPPIKTIVITPPTPPGFDPTADYRYADPATLVARQFALIDFAQQAARIEMQAQGLRPGSTLVAGDAKKIMDLSHALHRNLEALKKSSILADEMAARKTPEQLLEIAIKKIEGQNRAQIIAIIKRLRQYLLSLGPTHGNEMAQIDGKPPQKAADALADLAEGI